MGSWGIDMPRTNDDFVESAERIRTPLFAAAMDQCEPFSDVSTDPLDRQQVAALRPLPAMRRSGIVFIGDAICAFNPFYAQGISSAGARR